MKEKIIDIILKIILIISILIVLYFVVSMLFGIVKVYFKGINKHWILNNWTSKWISTTKKMVYKKEAVKIYLDMLKFNFIIGSSLGIYPLVILPIITFILMLFKKIYKSNILKIIGIILGIAVIVEIFVINKNIQVLMVINPYIICILLSYIIAYLLKNTVYNKFYK